jgi:hypothetical protein
MDTSTIIILYLIGYVAAYYSLKWQMTTDATFKDEYNTWAWVRMRILCSLLSYLMIICMLCIELWRYTPKFPPKPPKWL